MRRWLKITIPVVLLAAGAIVCAVRWQAWFVMPDEPVWTGDTIQYAFPPFEQDQTPQSLDILVLGDIHNQLTRADYDTLALRVPQADVVIQVGDWLERGQEYYRQLLLREWTNSGLYGLPVIACPGNHEYNKGIHNTLSPTWRDIFYPATKTYHPAPNGMAGVNYYVDFPGLRLIVIDTNPLKHLVYMTRALTWVQETMRSAGDRYIVALMHHPVLSTAKGRFNPGVYGTFRYALSQADLVIAGHDHNYMRRMPFVMLNTAGKAKQQRSSFSAEATYAEPVYGVLHLRNSSDPLIPNPLTLTVYRFSDGSVIDSVHVDHD